MYRTIFVYYKKFIKYDKIFFTSKFCKIVIANQSKKIELKNLTKIQYCLSINNKCSLFENTLKISIEWNL